MFGKLLMIGSFVLLGIAVWMALRPRPPVYRGPIVGTKIARIGKERHSEQIFGKRA